MGLVPSGRSGGLVLSPSPLEEDLAAALQTWLEELHPHTRRSYETGLRQFAKYLHEHGVIDTPSTDAAAVAFFGDGGKRSHGRANALAQAWLESMAKIDPGTGKPRYHPRTISARVTALRWAVKSARRRGHTIWDLDITVPKPKKDPKSGRLIKKPGRDMKGPPIEKIQEMYEVARKLNDGGVAETVLSLAFCETLRQHEIVQLDIEDINLRRHTLKVVRKKRHEEQEFPLSNTTLRAIDRVLHHTHRVGGPLLMGRVVRGSEVVSTDRRLSTSGVRYKIAQLADAVGIHTSAHRIRHSGITIGDTIREQLELAKQDAMYRAGHQSEQAHQVYLDVNLTKVRQITEGVGELIPSSG